MWQAVKSKAAEEAQLLELAKRREVIKNKVMAMGKMQMMFATLRQEKEKIVKLKGEGPPRFARVASCVSHSVVFKG